MNYEFDPKVDVRFHRIHMVFFFMGFLFYLFFLLPTSEIVFFGWDLLYQIVVIMMMDGNYKQADKCLSDGLCLARAPGPENNSGYN